MLPNKPTKVCRAVPQGPNLVRTYHDIRAAALDEKVLLTPKEFYEHALKGAIGINSVYELIRANRIQHIRIGRRILIPASEIRDFPRREAMKDHG